METPHCQRCCEIAIYLMHALQTQQQTTQTFTYGSLGNIPARPTLSGPWISSYLYAQRATHLLGFHVHHMSTCKADNHLSTYGFFRKLTHAWPRQRAQACHTHSIPSCLVNMQLALPVHNNLVWHSQTSWTRLIDPWVVPKRMHCYVGCNSLRCRAYGTF